MDCSSSFAHSCLGRFMSWSLHALVACGLLLRAGSRIAQHHHVPIAALTTTTTAASQARLRVGQSTQHPSARYGTQSLNGTVGLWFVMPNFCLSCFAALLFRRFAASPSDTVLFRSRRHAGHPGHPGHQQDAPCATATYHMESGRHYHSGKYAKSSVLQQSPLSRPVPPGRLIYHTFLSLLAGTPHG